MSATNPISVPLPADLPTTWRPLDTVPNAGSALGLPEQFGYNYLMQQVNAAQSALLQIGDYFPRLALETETGGYVILNQSISPELRRKNVLYGIILEDFSGEKEIEGGASV